MSAETIALDTSDPQVVRVLYTRVATAKVTVENTLVLDRASVPFVIEHLGAIVDDPGSRPPITQQVGPDNLRIYESGDPDRPFFNVHNRRAADGPYPGLSTIGASHVYAKKLVELLRQL